MEDPLHPCHDPRYRYLRKEQLPATEYMKDTVARFLPCRHDNLASAVLSGKSVLIAAHGNKLNEQLDIAESHIIMGNSKVSSQEAEKILNSEILTMTTTIRDYYPELVAFLEKMPGTLSDERNIEITYNQLKTYSESLNAFLTKYILEHPICSK